MMSRISSTDCSPQRLTVIEQDWGAMIEVVKHAGSVQPYLVAGSQ